MELVVEAEFGYIMMKFLPKILLLALALGATPQSLAGQLGDLVYRASGSALIKKADERILIAAQSDGPTLSEAVEMVRRQYQGRIVSAVTKTSGGREVHHIKVLTEDGKVKTVKIPGRSRQP